MGAVQPISTWPISTNLVRAIGVAALCTAAAVCGGIDPASAACTSTSPGNNATVDCSGTNTDPVIAAGSSGVKLNLLSGGSISPANGPSIWLGDHADIRLQGGTVTGDDALAGTYTILMGDSSVVTLDGTITGKAGITGLTQGSGSTGFSNAHITVGQTGKIIVSSPFSNYAALDGRGGGNVYQIDGELSGTSAFFSELIAVGSGDDVTLGATGKLTTQSEWGGLISNSSASGVKVTTAAGSLLQTDGAGDLIYIGDHANVQIAGTVQADGHAADPASFSSSAVSVGANSEVWLKEGGKIITGNASALGNSGDGAIGINTYSISGPSNSTVRVDGTIETNSILAHGIFAGTGDAITIGKTGKITTHKTSNGIFVRASTSSTDHHVSVDVAGRVEQLGTGRALMIQADQGPDLDADVTIEEGGSLYAAANTAYGQLDGAGSYGAIIDNLIVKGKIERGNSGKAIDLNDGADKITLFPTYSIIGGIDGGSASGGSGTQIDTFAFDGAADTTGTFDFDSIAVTNFEAGQKKGLGTWTLAGNAGTGINGTFAVEAGRLAVNGTMTSTDFNVLTGARLGGTGTIRSFSGTGTISPGNSIGTLHTATGAFGAGSTYEVEVDPTDSDRIVASGEVTIDPTAKVSVVPLAGTYLDGTEYLILDAGTRTGTFASVVDTSAFLDFTLDHDKDPNQVWLSVMNVAALPDVAETPNQLAAAGAVNEQGPGNGLFDAITMLDADSARHAFDLASGEIHATARAALLDDSRFIREAVLDRLRAPGGGAPVALAYADDGTALATGAGVQAWARAYGSGGTYRGDGNAADYDRSLGGIAFGVDGTVGAWRGGLAGGYQATSLDIDDRNSSASTSAVQLAAYGAFDSGPFALRVGGALAGNTIDTSRHVLAGDFDETLSAHYGAWSGQVFGEAAYRARIGVVDIEPFADLVHVAVATDGFDETGGIAALAANGRSDSATFAGAGARFGFALPSGLRFNGLIGWQHAFGDTTPTADLAFAGGTPFTIAGVPIARDVLRLEGGFDWALTPRATLGVSYSGQIGSGVSDHGANARLSVRF